MNRVYCCAELNAHINMDTVLCEGEIPPGSPKRVFMQSDGGHGGLEEVRHCPFCGKKIEYREEAAMSNALPGEHLCEKHQGNHSHYAEHNCTICKLQKQVADFRRALDIRPEQSHEEAIRDAGIVYGAYYCS